MRSLSVIEEVKDGEGKEIWFFAGIYTRTVDGSRRHNFGPHDHRWRRHTDGYEINAFSTMRAAYIVGRFSHLYAVLGIDIAYGLVYCVEVCMIQNK